MALATVLGEEVQELPHAFEVDGIADVAAHARGMNQSRAVQLFQVEGRAGGRRAHGLCNLCGGQTIGTFPHQKPENGEALIMGQCGEAGDGPARSLYPTGRSNMPFSNSNTINKMSPTLADMKASGA